VDRRGAPSPAQWKRIPLSVGVDLSGAIEDRIERFAPGFRARILARSVMPPAALERFNSSLVRGDINGGSTDLGQFFLRPTRRLYATPLRGVYLCSSSTPPGGAVHGMCGDDAARGALRRIRS
jgi:phytoene dehydrogenase-like protein